ncbi:hypothetical protein ABZ746_30115 [Streptomyces sp. NPDC020096]
MPVTAGLSPCSRPNGLLNTGIALTSFFSRSGSGGHWLGGIDEHAAPDEDALVAKSPAFHGPVKNSTASPDYNGCQSADGFSVTHGRRSGPGSASYPPPASGS